MPLEQEPFRETVIYIRTSTQDQNPLNQLQDCESIRPKDSKMNTFTNYMLIKEEQSAWNDSKQRKGFDKLKRLIKSRKLKNLIVWDLDRIYRNRLNIIAFFKLCKAYKVKIYSFRQLWLQDINNMPSPWDEAMHDLMLQIFGYIAEEESTKKSDRVKNAVRRKPKGTYSYKGNKWGRKQISTQKKNKILILQKEGKSMRQISAELDLSLGVVHKYLSKNPLEKDEKLEVQ